MAASTSHRRAAHVSPVGTISNGMGPAHFADTSTVLLWASRPPELPVLAERRPAVLRHRACAKSVVLCRHVAVYGLEPLEPDTPESSSDWLFDRDTMAGTASTTTRTLLDLTTAGFEACETLPSSDASPTRALVPAEMYSDF